MTEYSIKWDKKSRKVGKVLELMADGIDRVVTEQVEQRLAEAFDQGYETAMREVQEFAGLSLFEKDCTMDSSDKGTEGTGQK